MTRPLLDVAATGTRPQHELSLQRHGISAVVKAPTAAAACHRAAIALESSAFTPQQVADALTAWVVAHPAADLTHLNDTRSAVA